MSIFPDRHLAVRSMSQAEAPRKLQALQIAVVSIALLGTADDDLAGGARLRRKHRSWSAPRPKTSKTRRRLERTPERSAPRAPPLRSTCWLSRVQKLEQANGETQVRAFLGPYAAPPMYTALKGVYLERLRSAGERPGPDAASRRRAPRPAT